MPKNKWYQFLDVSLLIFTSIALVAGLACYFKGPNVFRSGLNASMSMLYEVIPRLVAATFLAGFVEVLTPKHWITKWMGQRSGLKGIVIGSLVGGFTPGGPVTSFPIVVVLFKTGAGIPPLIAFLTAWSVFAFHRIIAYEIPMIGARFAALRLLCSIVLPPLAGILAAIVQASLPMG